MADENPLVRAAGRAPGQSTAVTDDRSIASPDDLAAFQVRFLCLIERQTAVYTMGDSTSVPEHVAADLVRSVCFVLGIDLDSAEVPERLLAVDLEAEFRRNLAEVERKVALTGTLWRDAVASMPAIRNTALHDTLAAIGDFPKLYDYRSMAHEIPCVFDYPLCHPLDETLLGVDYINEYLRRLLVEFDFLKRFELGACLRVLEHSSPDYVDLPLNLYEPIATNAIGRAVIGEDPRPLTVSAEERARIAQRLEPLGEAKRQDLLQEAARAICAAIAISDERAEAYLVALVPDLLPRIEVGISRGELRGVFV